MNTLRFLYEEKIYPNRGKYSTKEHGKILLDYLKLKTKLEQTLPNIYQHEVSKLCEYAEETKREFGETMFEAGFALAMDLAAEIFRKEK